MNVSSNNYVFKFFFKFFLTVLKKVIYLFSPLQYFTELYVTCVIVQSGALNHHITRLDPLKPQNIDIDHLETMKFNVDCDFEINV